MAACQHIPIFVGLKAGFGQSSEVLQQDQITSIDEVSLQLSQCDKLCRLINADCVRS